MIKSLQQVCDRGGSLACNLKNIVVISNDRELVVAAVTCDESNVGRDYNWGVRVGGGPGLERGGEMAMSMPR